MYRFVFNKLVKIFVFFIKTKVLQILLLFKIFKTYIGLDLSF
jgi:hypothetical protein